MEKSLTTLEQAQRLHQHIADCGQRACEMIYEMGLGLKKMRDGKLYTALGFETFGDYVEHNDSYSFRERQAYSYIKLVEDNPRDYLTAHSDLGVTKLTLLSQLPGFEREEFIEAHPIAGMTVKEVEELIKEHQGIGEQLTMLTDEKEQAQTQAERLEQENARLRQELESLEHRPETVAVREPTEEEIQAIKQAAADEAREELEQAWKELEKAQKEAKHNEKALKKELEEAKIKARKELIKREDALEAAKTTAEKQLQTLRDRLAAAESEKATLRDKLEKGTPDESREVLKIYFAKAQEAVNDFIAAVDKLPDPEVQTRFRQGAVKWLEAVAQKLTGA